MNDTSQSSIGLLNILNESLCSMREECRLVPVQFGESSQVAGGRLKSQRDEIEFLFVLELKISDWLSRPLSSK